jgi:hypothetical protein
MNKLAQLIINHTNGIKTSKSVSIIKKIAKSLKEQGFKPPFMVTAIDNKKDDGYENLVFQEPYSIYDDDQLEEAKPLYVNGEWWIIGGNALYADGDIGDINHEGVVLDKICRDIFDILNINCNDEYIDFKAYIPDIEEAIKEEYPKYDSYKHSYFDFIKKILIKNGYENKKATETVNCLRGNEAIREYGCKYFGWKRVLQNSVQTYDITMNDRKEIYDGIYDILSEDHDVWTDNQIKIYLEIIKTKQNLADISLADLINPEKILR